MTTSAPEHDGRVISRLRHWRLLDRVIAAVLGALVVVLAYLAATSAYRFTDTYQQHQYDMG